MHSEVVELAQGLSTAANTSQNNIPGASNGLLRTVSRADWDRVCSLVSCTILSSRHNEHFDAYVLSESSCA